MGFPNADHNYIITIWHKILHGIKFYGFTVGDRTVKLKSINFYSINIVMSLLKYFSYKAKNKGSSSSSLLSLSVSLPTRVPSLSSQELDVTNKFVDKAVKAITVSTASCGK